MRCTHEGVTAQTSFGDLRMQVPVESIELPPKLIADGESRPRYRIPESLEVLGDLKPA
jgi:hypothetical protein